MATPKPQYHTTAQIGPKRHLRPDGFLMCMDVPLARIGEQIYGPYETPIQPRHGDEYVRIQRDPDEVFRAETIASAVGVPVTITHPREMEVTPDTYKELTVGHVLNPRRGSGGDSDYLFGDLLIGDKGAIELIERGLREVSCGYSCDYDEIGDEGSGVGRQRNIVINHLALVEKGRCGPGCAIGDHQPKQEARMRTTDRQNLMGRIFKLVDRAFRAKDETEKEAIREEMEQVAKDAAAAPESPSIEIHNHHGSAKDDDPMKDEDKEKIEKLEKKVDDGFKKIGDALEDLKKSASDKGARDEAAEKEAAEKKAADEKEEAERKKAEDEKVLGNLQMEAPSGVTGDQLRRANDSGLLEDSFHNTVAQAEILVPGISAPRFAADAKPAKTLDAMCEFRRTALDLAYAQPEGRDIIGAVLGGRALDTKTMDCAAVRTTFYAAAAMKRQRNNADNSGAAAGRKNNDSNIDNPKTPADLNKWADRKFRGAGA